MLDLGCGVGAAMYCLAARVGRVHLTGLEREAEYCMLARQNAEHIGCRTTLYQGCVTSPPLELRQQSFDHVIFNPPYHPQSALGSVVALRDRANREEVPLANWVGTALARLLPRGRLTVIHRAERLPELLAALGDRAGEVVVKPLAARIGRDAKRVIVTARKGARGPFRLAPPLVLHKGPAHIADADDFTEEASAILRDAAPLTL